MADRNPDAGPDTDVAESESKSESGIETRAKATTKSKTKTKTGPGSEIGTGTGAARKQGALDTARTLMQTLRRGDRRGFECALDGVVRRNRFTIAVVFPAVGAVMLVASAVGLLQATVAGVTIDLNFHPYLVLTGVAVMRLPLIAGVLPLIGRRAALAIGGLTLYAYAIELVGVITGVPYGEFEYLIDLGPMLAGVVPVGLPIFFFPLVLNAYLLVALLLGRHGDRVLLRVPAVVLAVVAMDLVLDPAAVSLGFWAYAGGGPYYDVPVSNYAGWVLSATIAVVAFDVGFRRTALLDRLRSAEFMLDDLVSFVLLWGPINAVFGNWGAVLVAVVFGVGLLITERFDFDVLATVPGSGLWRGRGR